MNLNFVPHLFLYLTDDILFIEGDCDPLMSFSPSDAAMLARFDSVGSSSNDPRSPLVFSTLCSYARDRLLAKKNPKLGDVGSSFKKRATARKGHACSKKKRWVSKVIYI